MLSIIIPHYNSNDLLIRLLKSIECGEAEIEVFVVDDGSSLFPDNINKENFTFKLQILKNRNGKGAGGARNTALDIITTEYVLFADADDEFIEGWYSIVKSYFTASNDIVFFSPDGLKENGSSTSRHLGYKKLITSYKLSQDKDILYKFHVPWSKLFRTDFIKREQIRFDEVIASNDVMFSLKSTVYCKKFCVDKSSIYRVYESADSMIKQTKFNSLKSRYDVLNRYNSFLLMNVQNANKYCISPLPIIFKIIKNRPFHGMKILITAFIKAPIIFAFRGTLNSIIRRFQSKK